MRLHDVAKALARITYGATASQHCLYPNHSLVEAGTVYIRTMHSSECICLHLNPSDRWSLGR